MLVRGTQRIGPFLIGQPLPAENLVSSDFNLEGTPQRDTARATLTTSRQHSRGCAMQTCPSRGHKVAFRLLSDTFADRRHENTPADREKRIAGLFIRL